MKLKNVTSARIKFECGSHEVDTGMREIYVAGERQMIMGRARVGIQHTVEPGDTIDLADGYCLPRKGGLVPRPSFLEQEGLADKLVPVHLLEADKAQQAESRKQREARG